MLQTAKGHLGVHAFTISIDKELHPECPLDDGTLGSIINAKDNRDRYEDALNNIEESVQLSYFGHKDTHFWRPTALCDFTKFPWNDETDVVKAAGVWVPGEKSENPAKEAVIACGFYTSYLNGEVYCWQSVIRGDTGDVIAEEAVANHISMPAENGFYMCLWDAVQWIANELDTTAEEIIGELQNG